MSNHFLASSVSYELRIVTNIRIIKQGTRGVIPAKAGIQSLTQLTLDSRSSRE